MCNSAGDMGFKQKGACAALCRQRLVPQPRRSRWQLELFPDLMRTTGLVEGPGQPPNSPTLPHFLNMPLRNRNQTLLLARSIAPTHYKG